MAPPSGAEFLGNQPELMPNINPELVRHFANQAGGTTAYDMRMAQDPMFNQFADQQFGQIGRLAGQLDNQYTRQARDQIGRGLTAAGQLGNMGASTMGMADQAGRSISALAPMAQGQATFAANNIARLAPQVIDVGDAAAAGINRMAPQVVGIGDQFMGQMSGLGNMLADQSRQGFATAGPTGIEQSLYNQGQAELAMGRSLSPEEMRDATQSARQGMAARGMATGNAAMGAELLNRDRFANQRQQQRRAFAAEANNLRERNVMDRRAAAGNMATAGGNMMDAAGRLGMAGREASSRMLDMGGRLGLTGREMAGQMFDASGRMNVLGTELAGNLMQSGADVSTRGRQVAGGMTEASGRMMMDGGRMMTDIDPYQRAISGGLSLGQTAQAGALDATQGAFNSMTDLFANAGSFNVNRGDSLFNSWMNNATAAKTGTQAANAQTNAANISAAATRSARPQWWETALGAVGNIFSDERMKTDVKPIGTAGNVLGLTAYEFRYKGDKKKHKGFMAQDVQKVLPEAVEEVDYKGKKRLTIKPMVIGAALAEELMSAKAA
jgi:hypothetical protein